MTIFSEFSIKFTATIGRQQRVKQKTLTLVLKKLGLRSNFSIIFSSSRMLIVYFPPRLSFCSAFFRCLFLPALLFRIRLWETLSKSLS